MEEIVTIFLFKNSKKRVKFVFSEFVGGGFVNIVTSLESATGEYGQSDGKDFSERRIHMGRIGAFLNQIVVDFFGSQKDRGSLVNIIDGVLYKKIVVGNFSWEGDRADDFDLSAFIDEYVLRVDITDFLF